MLVVFFLKASVPTSNIKRLTNKAVKTEDATPMAKLTAKPWIVPVPNWLKNMAAMKVVMLESIIAQKAPSQPASMAAPRLFPRRNSSLMR